MLTPNVVLKDDQKILAAVLAGAKNAHARIPGGPEYVVEVVNPGRKPVQMWYSELLLAMWHLPRAQSGDGVVVPTGVMLYFTCRVWNTVVWRAIWFWCCVSMVCVWFSFSSGNVLVWYWYVFDIVLKRFV